METSLQLLALQLLRDGAVQLGFLLAGLLILCYAVKAQPTRRAFFYILLPVPLLGLAFFVPALEWLPVVYNPLLMIVLLLDAFAFSAARKHVHIKRDLAPKFSTMQPNAVMLSVTNDGPREIRGTVRDHVPDHLYASADPALQVEQAVTVPAYGNRTVTYTLTPTARGQYAFGQTHFRYLSGWGLLWLTLESGRRETVTVVPDLRRIRKMRVKYSRGLSTGELQKRHLGQEGTQFSGLRNYYVGDDVRKMAWQASAKLDMPVIRTFDHEVEQPILVLLDAGRKMQTLVKGVSKFDWALNSALSFMSVAIDRGDCVGAGVFSNQVMAHLPVSAGKSHLNAMLESLSQIQPRSLEPHYETVMVQFARSLKRRSLVVIFTDLIDPMASRNLLRSLRSFSANHLLMIVTFSDAHITQVASRNPATAYEAYERGVASDLQAARHKSLLELSKSRQAIVIDAAPDQLDEALIQKYLILKQRNQF